MSRTTGWSGRPHAHCQRRNAAHNVLGAAWLCPNIVLREYDATYEPRGRAMLWYRYRLSTIDPNLLGCRTSGLANCLHIRPVGMQPFVAAARSVGQAFAFQAWVTCELLSRTEFAMPNFWLEIKCSPESCRGCFARLGTHSWQLASIGTGSELLSP